jgi:hypothetical protein
LPFQFLALEPKRGLVGVNAGGAETPLPSGREEFSDAVLFADESAVLLLRRRGGVKVVDLTNRDVMLALPAPAAGEWRRLALDRSNHIAAAIDRTGGVAFWDLQTGRRWGGERLEDADGSAAFRVLDDGKTLVSVSIGGRIGVWHVATGRLLVHANCRTGVFDAELDGRKALALTRSNQEAPLSVLPLVLE